MRRVEDGLFSVLVTAIFASLLMVAGGAGPLLALALIGCGVYRMRCSLIRAAHYGQPGLHASVIHG